MQLLSSSKQFLQAKLASSPNPRHAKAVPPPTKRSSVRMSASTKLMNSPDSLVSNALDGLIMQHPHLTKLDGFPDVSVVCLCVGYVCLWMIMNTVSGNSGEVRAQLHTCKTRPSPRTRTPFHPQLKVIMNKEHDKGKQVSVIAGE